MIRRDGIVMGLSGDGCLLLQSRKTVKIVLPEDLGSMEGRLYIHDVEQLKWAAIGAEDARMVALVGMSKLQCRHLSEDSSKDRN